MLRSDDLDRTHTVVATVEEEVCGADAEVPMVPVEVGRVVVDSKMVVVVALRVEGEEGLQT